MKPQIKRLKRALGLQWRGLRYRGKARWCPVCRKGSRAFLPFGQARRPDARCPVCGAVERHRLFWLYIERKTDFRAHPPVRALHVAPETMLEYKLRGLIGRGYMTADLFAPNVDVKMDVSAMPFAEESFEFIYCSHVLEHVPDDRKAMREFFRVLTRGGLAILLVPITAEETFEDPTVVDPAERLRLFGQDDHVRRYGPDYLARLQEAGFEVEVVRRGDFLGDDESTKMGVLGETGDLYICRK